MIMAPVLHGPNFGSFRWSKCARQNLNAFLHSDESYCLFETAPSSVEIEIPRVRIRSVSTRSIAPKLPGETYSADEQCKFQFGQKSRTCTFGGIDVCKRLYCKIYNEPRCRSILLPAAEGSIKIFIFIYFSLRRKFDMIWFRYELWNEQMVSIWLLRQNWHKRWQRSDRR